MSPALDPPPANSPTMHKRLIPQDRNACLGEPAYFPETKLIFKPSKLPKPKKRDLSVGRAFPGPGQSSQHLHTYTLQLKD